MMISPASEWTFAQGCPIMFAGLGIETSYEQGLPVMEDASSPDLRGPSASERIRQWVEEHGDYLLQYATRYFRDRTLAEDLVQETFLAAVRGESGFAGDSSPRTWLTAILRHKIFDRVRRGKREVQLEDESGSDDGMNRFFDEVEHWRAETGPRDWELSPEDVVQHKQFMGILGGCLRALPERIRNMFVLREVDGLTREEIAKLLDLSANNVGVILHRARLQLRNCLQVNWLEGEDSA